MDEALWPARNVAEYAYCPRLFYYMEVEGIHVPSHDTVEGVRIHRRVDAPSLLPDDEDEADEDRPAVARSLTLTSPRLGLTATLDLAEIAGETAIPVEYRKGRPFHPRDDSCTNGSVEPWPTDRVQVGLQALLLEEAGYRVPNAVLYYAAERRRVTVVVDDALRQEALATLDSAKQCATGPRPLPLLNDPRCPRCSLQPICLPDEVHNQRGDDGGVSPRKMWPPRDDGIHLVAQQKGTKLGVRGSSLTVTEADGSKVRDVPLASVESLSLLGSVQVSTQALHVLADKSIPVAFLSAAGRLVAMLDPLDSVSAEVRRAQVRRLDRPEIALELSRALVVAKIQNQRTLLMRNNKSLPPRASAAMSEEIDSAKQAASIESLRGHEGQAAAIYFENFAGMLEGDLANEFDVNGRQRRPPPDPINSCLSFAYSMLTHECTAALRTARLEPSIGAFHVSRPGRPALALDLMEPFRPLIADSAVLSAINTRMVTPRDFVRAGNSVALKPEGRKAFFRAYEQRMDTLVTHPIFGYRVNYRRVLEIQARLLARVLTGELNTYPVFTTR